MSVINTISFLSTWGLSLSLSLSFGSKEKLLGILDKHCYEENHKLSKDGAEKLSESGGGEISSAAFSEFDFLYLPIDFTYVSTLFSFSLRFAPT